MTKDRRKGSVLHLPSALRSVGVSHKVQGKEDRPAVLGEWEKLCG